MTEEKILQRKCSEVTDLRNAAGELLYILDTTLRFNTVASDDDDQDRNKTFLYHLLQPSNLNGRFVSM